MKTYLTLLGCCITLISTSQINREYGADIHALAGNSVAYHSPFASMKNPSLATLQTDISLSVSYSNKFLLKELQAQSLQLHLPIKKSVQHQCFVFGIRHFGHSLYRDIRFNLGYAMELSERLSLGVQLNYLYLAIGQGDFIRHKLSGDMGLHYQLNEKTRLGMSVLHLNEPRIDLFLDAGYRSTILLGAVHELSEGIEVLGQIEKSNTHPYVLASGIRYQAHEKLELLAGIRFPTWEYALGFSYRNSWYKLICAFRFAQQLSGSPSSSFIISSFENE